MREPYRAANRFAPLKSNRSDFAEWLSFLNRVLCVALKTAMLIDDSPSLIKNRSLEENRAICHFLDASIPHKFALCIGFMHSQLTAKEFFDAIKVRCCPGNRFKKLRIVRKMLGMLVKNGSGAP
ncbi:hypothetical protein O181_082101 [Austropuccinia psidii MF-1]|uniref:Uncharacterized protein n=1 Tax=Austropuccinia psidii MF-1 TaxID=1389203 RepID=A0A9Q3FLG8_9BASI|nr:hypothetical protein [Austropuccinia psidii MF-1]